MKQSNALQNGWTTYCLTRSNHLGASLGPAGPGLARLGMAMRGWAGKAGCGAAKAVPGMARLGRRVVASQGLAWPGKARHGTAG
jgi:hypothetical protein